MDKRRAFKGRHEEKYKEVRIAKENFYSRKCEEIEELQAKHDTFKIHKKLKKLAGT